MRDPIVTIALAGTSRQEHVTLSTGTPVDALLTELPEGEIERAFLLGAGARAIYRQAGKRAQQFDETPAPAVDERLPACSAGTALLLSRLLTGEHGELLPEALARMSQQGLRLPFHLLPVALDTTQKETRAALFPLLGARGRWLSQFRSSWQWVHHYLGINDESLPADAETIWQEGTTGQRVEILRRLRAFEPDKARAWLANVWKQEKAEVRCDLLAVLKIGLRSADEPFLEQALDDRAGSVRSVAADLLSNLPDAAFGERMRQRALSMVRIADGRITAEPPATFPTVWQRDGLSEKPSTRLSPRAWWLLQILTMIEPSFWEKQFGMSPAALLNALAEDEVWRFQVIEGWFRATRKFGTPTWLETLLSWWLEHYQEVTKQHQLSEYSYGEELLRLMPAAMAERVVLKLIEGQENNPALSWSDLLAGLPRPWSPEFTRVYLHFLRANCTMERMQNEHFNPYGNPWLTTLSSTALALPVSCLAEASRDWELTERGTWQVQYATRQLKEWLETIQMRQKIYEEMN